MYKTQELAACVADTARTPYTGYRRLEAVHKTQSLAE